MSNTLVIILISLAFSAMFSGVEIAFVSSNKLRFELDKQMKSFASRILTLFYKHPDQFISTMLVGNNIALVVYGIQMANLIESPLSEYIDNSALIVFIQTLISTSIILMTAEFLPKTLFRIDSNVSLKIFAVPALLCYIVLYPISLLISFLSNIILRVLGVRLNKNSNDRTINKIDLDYFIQSTLENSGEKKGEIDTEVKMFQNVLDFSNVKLRDCMVPRTELIAVEQHTDWKDLMTVFVETGLSKVLVYKDNIDNIIGYIHSSEMFNKPVDWIKCIKPVPIVPETMAANKLMKLLMTEKKSMVVVVDEFGGLSGVVTLEDLVEEILGDIEDEHDVKNLVAKKINENEYIVSGRMEIDALNEKFALNIPEADDYVTIAGYILHHYQKFPMINESIEIGDYTFKVVKATSTKIELLRLKVKMK